MPSGTRNMLPSNAELEPPTMENASPPALVSRGDHDFRGDLETNEISLEGRFHSELIDEVVVGENSS